MGRAFGAGLVLALLAVACADATDTLEARQQAVIDGTIDDTTGVVFVTASNGAGMVTCSGVLIAPNVVLTARSCVSEESTPYVDCGQTMFTGTAEAGTVGVSDERSIGENATFTEVAEIRVPEAVEVCGNDIAMLVLAEPLDGEPIALGPQAAVAAGQEYTVHGYGSTSPPPSTGSPVRNSGSGEIVCVGEQCPSQVADAEFMGSDRACGSDGGGPAVVAEGAIGLAVRGSGMCEGSTLTSIPAWADWIAEQTRAAADENGFEVPTWAALPDTGADMGDEGMPDAGGMENNDTSDVDMGMPSDSTDESSDDGCSTAGTKPDSVLWVFLLLAFARFRR